MKVNWANMRLVAAVPGLMAAASCVPASHFAVASPMPVAARSAAQPQGSPAEIAAERKFWKRAGELLAPVSATPAAPFAVDEQSNDDRARSLDCLTSAIYYEARSEPEDGQRAVAQVVLNRVRHPAFPSTVCGVVFQGSERRTGCQFSFTCDGSMARRPQPEVWERVRRIAAEALSGSVFAPVGNATHYHTTSILPYWAPYLRKSAIVGAHIFYRWSGNAGEASAFRQRYGGLEPVRTTWSENADALPRVHRGTAQQPSLEEVQLDDGAIRIHRGSATPASAATTARFAAEAPIESIDRAADFGVQVHHGSTPAA
ncbi:MAG: cell wall hydrolase [Alphaproteobacteria bacterium]|nr:cell wall hydrolase [Alphaproteobacteria bacterium]